MFTVLSNFLVFNILLLIFGFSIFLLSFCSISIFHVLAVYSPVSMFLPLVLSIFSLLKSSTLLSSILLSTTVVHLSHVVTLFSPVSCALKPYLIRCFIY